MAAILLAYTAGVLAVLLSPTSPAEWVAASTEGLRRVPGLGSVRQGWVEFGANVLLFAPLGALITLLVGRPWVGVLTATTLSAAAELAQLLLPGRTSTARDVLANVLGALIGALIVVGVQPTVRGPVRERTSAPSGSQDVLR